MKRIKIGSNMSVATNASGAVILFSYDTPVAAKVPGAGYYRTSTKWSSTTTRHINKWLGPVSAEELPQEYFDKLAEG